MTERALHTNPEATVIVPPAGYDLPEAAAVAAQRTIDNPYVEFAEDPTGQVHTGQLFDSTADSIHPHIVDGVDLNKARRRYVAGVVKFGDADPSVLIHIEGQTGVMRRPLSNIHEKLAEGELVAIQEPADEPIDPSEAPTVKMKTVAKTDAQQPIRPMIVPRDPKMRRPERQPKPVPKPSLTARVKAKTKEKTVDAVANHLRYVKLAGKLTVQQAVPFNLLEPKQVVEAAPEPVYKTNHKRTDWRVVQPSATPNSTRLSRLTQRQQAALERDKARAKIGEAKLVALVRDDRKHRLAVYEAQESYHNDRAEGLGSYVLSVESSRPRFAKVKSRVAQTKLGYHRKQAQKATKAVSNEQVLKPYDVVH